MEELKAFHAANPETLHQASYRRASVAREFCRQAVRIFRIKLAQCSSVTCRSADAEIEAISLVTQPPATSCKSSLRDGCLYLDMIGLRLVLDGHGRE
jgi:hypothetical protein